MPHLESADIRPALVALGALLPAAWFAAGAPPSLATRGGIRIVAPEHTDALRFQVNGPAGDLAQGSFDVATGRIDLHCFHVDPS
jgi:hypothetical protein